MGKIMQEGDDNTLAIISLVTAILGFMMTPLIMSIIAVICGRIQLKKIEEDPETYGGKTLALIGFWVGLVRGITVLLIFVMVIFIYVIMFLFLGISIFALGA